MRNCFLVALAATVALGAVQPARAAITWTSWNPAASGATTATGTAGGINVTYAGQPVAFVQSGGIGTNYYSTGTAFPPAYQPPNSDIVGLNTAGNSTLTFSTPVTNLFLALVSWNANTVSFSQPFVTVTPLSETNYWGSGTLPASGTSFSSTSSNEVAGVLEFTGPISSLTINTTTDEYWHGFTVGFDTLAARAVPEPSTWVMMLLGFGAIGFAMRRKRAEAVATS